MTRVVFCLGTTDTEEEGEGIEGATKGGFRCAAAIGVGFSCTAAVATTARAIDNFISLSAITFSFSASFSCSLAFSCLRDKISSSFNLSSFSTISFTFPPTPTGCSIVSLALSSIIILSSLENVAADPPRSSKKVIGKVQRFRPDKFTYRSA